MSKINLPQIPLAERVRPKTIEEWKWCFDKNEVSEEFTSLIYSEEKPLTDQIHSRNSGVSLLYCPRTSSN